MEGRLVLKNCAVVTRDGRVRSGVAIVIERERIARIAPDAEVPVLPGDWEIAARGRLVVPGLADCHAHLVGSLLLPPSLEVRLDTDLSRARRQHLLEEALTADEVEVLTAFALANAARAGVTFVAEHLTSPADVLGSLRAQARAAERIGVRFSNSHASSIRSGAAAGLAQVEQNAEYVRTMHTALVRPAIGFESSSVADDALLRCIAEAHPASVHFHLGATDEDLRLTYERHGTRIVPRLDAFGLLAAGTVAAYARVVDQAEIQRLWRTRAVVALTPAPRHSADPVTRTDAAQVDGIPIALGSADAGSFPRALTLAADKLVERARQRRVTDPDGFLRRLVHAGAGMLCDHLYGAPVALLEEGALADLAVHDWVFPIETGRPPVTNPLLLLGDARAAWTIVHGRVLVREGQLLGVDYVSLARDATAALEAVRARAFA